MLTSFSQPATKQDLWVLKRLDGKRDGYFIEIGAHNGIRHSNTFLLEQDYGWTGLLVEPQGDLYAQCFHSRSTRNKYSDQVVGPEDGQEIFFLNGDAYGGAEEFMPDDWLHEHKLRGTNGEYRKTRSLFTLLEDHRVPSAIDYMSIDVEGAEYPILDSFFTRAGYLDYQFGIITVEFRYDDVLLSKLEDRLASHYRLEHVEAFDAFFVHKGLPRK